MSEVNQEIPVLDHGYVILRGVMGSDADIANAARISYDKADKYNDADNEKLIRFLMRNRHTSPFEMAELKFELKMPIFVMRQWIRHRTANVNEMSARYTQLPDEMFVPDADTMAVQSTSNKQGRDDFVFKYEPHHKYDMRKKMKRANRDAYDVYEDLLGEFNLSREMARSVLPLSTYTKCVWKIDLHNLLHFLKLRTDKHAQYEIRAFADEIETIVRRHFPITYKAWVDYVKESYTLSKHELKFVQEMIRIYSWMRTMEPERANAEMNSNDKYLTETLSDREITAFCDTVLKNMKRGDD